MTASKLAKARFPELSTTQVAEAAWIERNYPDYGSPAFPADQGTERPRKVRAVHGQDKARREYARREVPLPTWFLLEDYNLPLDAAGWALVFDRLAAYRQPGGYLRWLYDRIQDGPLVTWAAHLADARRSGLASPGHQDREGTTSHDLMVDAPPEMVPLIVPELEGDEDSPLLPIPMGDAMSGAIKDMPLASRELLLVDRHGFPEAVLREHFRRWLVSTRRPGPIPGGKRGPRHNGNAAFDETHFDAWHKQRIVPFFELRLWSHRHGVRYTNEQLWRLLFPDASTTSDAHRIRYTDQLLWKALETGDVLGNQVRDQLRS